jgi:hypothetical protein
MTKSATRVAADKVTFTQTEVTSAITAGDTAARAGRKNWIINGDFQISQRGSYTSATALTSSSVYHLDRFKSKHNNISGTITHKLAQTVNGKVTNTMLLTATAGSNGRVEGVQQIEATKPFVSQTITFSAWVKSNSASSRLIIHQGGANIQTSSNQHTGGGAFELLKGTVTCAANSGDIFLYAGIQAAGTGNVAIANGDYFEMAFVQVELGSVATDFEHRSYGEELALCQRYYEVIASGASNSNQFFGIGQGAKSDQINWFYDFKVEKRGAFTLEVVSSQYQAKTHSATRATSTLGMTSAQQNLGRISAYMTSISNVTEHSAWQMSCSSSSAHIAVSAEL